jgi:acyl-homoserine lactone acylase PvdQ
MSEIEARQVYASAPDWLKELCIAFADGINYYLTTHPEVTPSLITHFEPWMPMYFFEGSIGGDIESVPLDRIAAFYGGSSGQSAPPPVRQSEQPDPEPAGSNGIAIAGQLTDNGNPLLLINPHTSFYFRGEVHMVSEEGLNAYGAVTWGQFFIYQGFNEHTGWMHTSTYADFMDDYLEEIVRNDEGLHYRYGGGLRPVGVSAVNLRYREGSQLLDRSFTTYRTHRGPIVGESEGRWIATRLNWDPVNALRQSWLRTRQTNLEEFHQIMQIRTNSSNNTVYADSSGNIAYYHGNFMPRRNPGFDYSLPLDGSNPATDWQGLHEVDEMIAIRNPDSGWIQNCNSTPFTAAGDSSPRRGDYPLYMAPDPENFRGIHAARLLTDIADSDEDRFSMAELIALAYHPALPAFEVVLPPLHEHYQTLGASYADLGPVVQALTDWDTVVAADSIPMTVAHFYATAIQEKQPAGYRKGRMAWLTEFAGTADGEEQLILLRGVVAALEADFGSWQVPWGEVNRFQRLDGAIRQRFSDGQPSLAVGMASGRWGALAAYGAKRGESTRKLYGYRGNSFVAVVEFGEQLRAKSLLAGGQSGNPGSPHFLDQAERYLDRDFKEVAFYREDVEARATRRYQPGER